MMGHILMADRRGLLRGNDISPVQETALYYIAFHEVQERNRELASITRVTTPTTVEAPVREIAEDEIESFEGTLIFPTEGFDPFEAEKILAEIGPVGRMTLADIDNEWK